MEPETAPFLTGDVVISVPARKPLELLTFPDIDPSAFCRQFDNTGTFGGGVFLPNTLSDPERLGTATSDFFIAVDPKRLKVGDCFVAGVSFFTGTEATFGALKSVNVFVGDFAESFGVD